MLLLEHVVDKCIYNFFPGFVLFVSGMLVLVINTVRFAIHVRQK